MSKIDIFKHSEKCPPTLNPEEEGQARQVEMYRQAMAAVGGHSGPQIITSLYRPYHVF